MQKKSSSLTASHVSPAASRLQACKLRLQQRSTELSAYTPPRQPALRDYEHHSIPSNGMGLSMMPAKLRAADCAGPAATEVVPEQPEGLVASALEAFKDRAYDTVSYLTRDCRKLLKGSSPMPWVESMCVCVQDIVNEVVYDSSRPAAQCVSIPCSTGEVPAVRWDAPECIDSQDGTCLTFESRFESGNLRRVTRIRAREFDLELNPDINSGGHTQWFYFSVANGEAGETYTFNIVNLSKPESLFAGGMQPLVHSAVAAAQSVRHCAAPSTLQMGIVQHARTNRSLSTFRPWRRRSGSQLGACRADSCLVPVACLGRVMVGRSRVLVVQGHGWHRQGHSIAYFRTPAAVKHAVNGKHSYTLTFKLLCGHVNDVLHVAACYPYTVSDLSAYLAALELGATSRALVRREILCKTLAGNHCDLLTITQPCTKAEMSARQGVVLSARCDLQRPFPWRACLTLIQRVCIALEHGAVNSTEERAALRAGLVGTVANTSWDAHAGCIPVKRSPAGS